MAKIGAECKRALNIIISWLLFACVFVAAEEDLEPVGVKLESGYLTRIVSFLQQSRDMLFPHVWPDMEFGWRIVLGTVIGFFGAALGSVGGVGGGGIFVPMLTLIIGFDPKSSTAVSKCMITGAAFASVYYNLKRHHPKLDLPIIDYNLALLFQPMLVLGISIGVFFNIIFAEWMVTVLLIVLFIGTSTKAFFKGVETWKKETKLKKMKLAARLLASDYTGNEEAGYKLLPGDPTDETKMRVNEIKQPKVSIINNVLWKEVGILFAVWSIILVLHISKDFTALCSATYWTVTLLQIPVAIGAFGYQAVCLYQGRKVVESTGDTRIEWTVPKLILCCICGMLSGIVGGLLGLGGGFIMGPLLLELGIPPQVHFFLRDGLHDIFKKIVMNFEVMHVYEQSISLFGRNQLQVSSATSTFVMAFSSSMSVIQYYLLRRFPPSYALYFVAVATFAALVGQHVVLKMISLFRRASLIIFVLAFTIFVSAIFLGWVGIENIIGKVQGREHLWFYNICEYVII